MTAPQPIYLRPPLDLSAAHVRGWHAFLPRDFKAAFGDEIPSGDDDALRDLSAQMGAVATRGYPEVLWRNADLVARMGRPRRVRLLAWITQICWPESDKVLSRLTDVRLDEGEEGSGSLGGAGDGRAKVAPLFLSDLEALAGRVIERGARAVADRGAVRAVEAGIRDFEDAFGPQTTGGI